MSPHADYKHILSQSLSLLGTIHPQIGSSLSLLCCQDIATWTAGHCPWGHLYKRDSYHSSALLVLVASFLLVTGKAPAGLMAKPMGLRSAAGEPHLRAETVGQPSSLVQGRFLSQWLCNFTQAVFLSGVQDLEPW